ncbi:NUDIX domain-containing protein [Pseudomonas wadenswilerensis]|uniref:NUDIX hydrolase n=2 Tax=Pseudomonas TaxID=286 RepID=UPI000FC12375|nr:NUDIX domain-containing protein [Pseudomonas wadenswilerensis]UVM19863.1 NUDIX domain-containing protein [Pseudomonas wadenswilerensis]
MMFELPRLGCGAAIVRDGRILLIQRLKEPEAGCWGLPGGKVDFLEEVEHAVVREIDEELGIQLRDMTLLCVVNQIDSEKKTHWVAPVYKVSRFDGDPYLVEPEKHSAIGWFSLEMLPTLLTVATRAALPLLRKQLT